MAYGWVGTARELVVVDPRALSHVLREAHQANYSDAASPEQVRAWSDELSWLSASLHAIPDASDWVVVLEYELPLQGGRRPDAVVLARDRILVLEFKSGLERVRAHVDQLEAYARDLMEYHSTSRDRQVVPILIYTARGGLNESFEGTPVIGPDFLARALREHAGTGQQIDAADWLTGVYAPLPTLVQAARRLFAHEPLPAIRSVEHAGIPALLTWLHDLRHSAMSSHGRDLVLITGVPGSGKTLVGLQFVYDASAGEETDAIFFSGNDPLVSVLQDAVGSKAFIKRWHDFDLEYGVRGREPPRQHVLVFDEAQRAWDETRMRDKKHFAHSEPAIAVGTAAGLDKWGLVIGLVGEGQEIYLGEEGGLGQWASAVRASSTPFRVHVPLRLEGVFAGLDVETSDRLDLTVSLRSHTAARAHEWVAQVLSGDLIGARSAAEELRRANYDLYATDNLMDAKRYLMTRYDSAAGKHFGLLASAKARNLRPLGIDNEFQAMVRLNVPRWFNASPDDPLSSCQLSVPTTEFQCQGLELDMPLLCWGDDLGWSGNGWISRRHTRDAHDSHQLRLNAYRVLMTRGRDGLVVYAPPSSASPDGGSVLGALREAGMADPSDRIRD